MRKIKQWLGFYKKYTVYYNGKPVSIREGHYSHNYKSHEFPGHCFLINFTEDYHKQDVWMETGIDDILIDWHKMYYISEGQRFYTASKQIND
jgi:hypothetical protein